MSKNTWVATYYRGRGRAEHISGVMLFGSKKKAEAWKKRKCPKNVCKLRYSKIKIERKMVH